MKERVIAEGKIRTIDGRYIPIRAQHAALNSLLQSAGAVVCKMWVNTCHSKMKELGYTHGKEYKQSAYVHDELQWRFDPTKVSFETLKKVSEESIKEVGELLKIRLPLAVDCKLGDNWAETH